MHVLRIRGVAALTVSTRKSFHMIIHAVQANNAVARHSVGRGSSSYG